VAADPLGEEFKGYVLKITGGHDKQGFGMKQGVLLNHRTRLLLDGTTGQYRPKRDGARKRKSVRGCVVGNDLSCINLVIVKRGEQDIPKLTEKSCDRPSTRGPKRASHIRAVWGLSKGEDVRKYVVRRKIPGKNGKPDTFKSPKIQRLITPVVRRRKKALLRTKQQRYEKSTAEAAEYQKLLAQKRQAARASLLSKKRATKSEKKSVKSDEPKKDVGESKGTEKAKTVKTAKTKTTQAKTKATITPKTAESPKTAEAPKKTTTKTTTTPKATAAPKVDAPITKAPKATKGSKVTKPTPTKGPTTKGTKATAKGTKAAATQKGKDKQ